MSRPAFAAVWSLRTGSVGLALLAIGPLLIQLGITAPMGGFLVFQVGLLLGLVTLGMAVVGVLRTRPASQREGRPQAVTGLALGLAVLTVVAFAARDGGGVPAINDITTNTQDPPQFDAIAKLEANRDRDMSFPGPLFADLGREEYVAQLTAAYPDLTTLERAASPSAAVADVVDAIETLGWAVVHVDPAAGRALHKGELSSMEICT